MAKQKDSQTVRPTLAVDVVEWGHRARRGWLRCELGTNIKFSMADLASYFFAAWDPTVYDAFLVAAVVEFADRTQRRPALTWQREFELNIPVHDPSLWSTSGVSETLKDALVLLTGDLWHITFYKRRRDHERPQQGHFTLPQGTMAVMPFSDGLDSRAVAGLIARWMGDKFVRVRLGTKDYDGHVPAKRPFTSVPYDVKAGTKKFAESSARSRGFKFALISSLAAYLAKAWQVIVPESGQGALGPALVVVGQGYEDYRSHPLFTGRIEKFLYALLRYDVRFQFPRIWHTKAETLKRFVEECEDGPSWRDTWSCWQQNRHSSVGGKRRHCGVCAACMLRRLSVHAAGLHEAPETYLWEKLEATSFDQGAAERVPEKKKGGRMRHYAVAGALHLDHLASLRSSASHAATLKLSAFQLGRALSLPQAEAGVNLDRLLAQHESEWSGFMHLLGDSSFVTHWSAAPA